MVNFFRKLTYSSELLLILNEEEQLILEWNGKWAEMNKSYSKLMSWKWIFREKLSLENIWNEIGALRTEVSKLEEIKKILHGDELQFSIRKRRALRQLRRKLDWKPFKLKEYINAYMRKIGNDDLPMIRSELADNHNKEYNKHMGFVVGRETNLWHHLNDEKEKLKSIINEQHEDVIRKRIISLQFLRNIESGQPRWWRGIERFTGTGEHGSFMEMRDAYGDNPRLWERARPFWLKTFSDIVKIANDLDIFFNRLKVLLKDIEQKLMRTYPI